eukprot:TRINITY_DN92312_c0_g1_i1.p1 TRINITY_DN92312_c0_g1~~TRINITY_DN92312_c0_g1_i1.p1  ORF type:complete len:776 (-),score=93.23 TRINITY_DN92312_c0_g1_i1:26-2353(-)
MRMPPTAPGAMWFVLLVWLCGLPVEASGDEESDGFAGLEAFVSLHCWGLAQGYRERCCSGVVPHWQCWVGMYTKSFCCRDWAASEVEKPKFAAVGSDPTLVDDVCEQEWGNSSDAAHSIPDTHCAGPLIAKATVQEGGILSLTKGNVFLTDISAYEWDFNVLPPDLTKVTLGDNARWTMIRPRWHTLLAKSPERSQTQVIAIVRPSVGGRRYSNFREAKNRRGQFDKVRPREGVEDRPSIYMLVLDSVSRTTLRRYMPLTNKLLQKLAGEHGAGHRAASGQGKQKEPKKTGDANVEEMERGTADEETTTSHTAFRFRRYHTLSMGGTVTQMFPLLYGGLKPCRVKMEHVASWFDYNMTEVLASCSAFPGGLPRLFRKAGYRLGFATVNWGSNELSRALSHDRWDHILPQLGGILGATFPRDMFCMGNRRYHEIILQWAMDVLDMYKGMPVFLYAHLDGSHKARSEARFIDRAVRDHLEEVMRRHPDVTIVLKADHGFVFKPCDQKAPMLNLLVPKRLLEARPELAEGLESNQDKLVAPFDLFMTFRHFLKLSTWQKVDPDFRQPFSMLRSLQVPNLVSSMFRYNQLLHSISLKGDVFNPTTLLEPIRHDRTCANAGIADFHCLVGQAEATKRVFCVDYDGLSEVTQQQFARAAVSSTATKKSVCKSVMEALNPYITSSLSRFREGPYKRGKPHICKVLTLQNLELIERQGNVFSLRLRTHQGTPNAVFDLLVKLNVASLTPTFGIMAAAQVTRWQQYKRCTPQSVIPEFCVCDLP